MTISSVSNATLFDTAASTATRRNLQTGTAAVESDGTSVSDFAKLIQKLLTLEKTDPEEFKCAAAKIGEKLSTAAAQAEKEGDTRRAAFLSELSEMFRTASQNGEFPSFEGKGDTGPIDYSPVRGPSRGGRAPAAGLAQLISATRDDLSGILASALS